MRPSLEAHRAMPSAELRRLLGRLEGLPIRPLTAAAALEACSDAAGEPQWPGFLALDPGWVLQAGERPDLDRAIPILADRPWWAGNSQDADEALERLWRHAVAASSAARRLAIEANREDAGAIAAAALLNQIGLWAVAAVDPETLAEILAIPDPRERRDRERALLGQEATALGRDLAERWGCDPRIVDAAWLHAGELSDLADAAHDPEAIRIVQDAFALAERTPWALGRKWPSEPSANDPRLRILIAEVQVKCGAGLLDPEAGAREERLSRNYAKLLAEHRRLRRELEEREEILAAIARHEVAGETTAATAHRAFTRLVADRAHQVRRLDGVVSAHRERVEREAVADRTTRLEALAEFAAGAGHELNNPLAVILGRAQLLLPSTDDPNAARSLRIIIAQAQRAHRILRDLIYVARPPAHRPRPCQPDEIVRACVRDLKDEAEARGVRLIAEVDEPIPIAWADPDPLRHMADLLVRNAMEATPPGGTVRLITGKSGEQLSWTVRDTGRGIGPAEGAHLFDPFYCGRQAGRGLGLGLSRVARFVARSQGELAWRSTPGKGTTFSIKLPIEPDNA